MTIGTVNRLIFNSDGKSGVYNFIFPPIVFRRSITDFRTFTVLSSDDCFDGLLPGDNDALDDEVDNELS
jgi:hypothetical protein